MQLLDLLVMALTEGQVDHILTQVDSMISLILKCGGVIGSLVTTFGIPYLIHRQSKNQKDAAQGRSRISRQIEEKSDVIVTKVNENTDINVKALDAANNVTSKATASHETATAAMGIVTAALGAMSSTPAHVIVDNDTDHALPVKPIPHAPTA